MENRSAPICGGSRPNLPGFSAAWRGAYEVKTLHLTNCWHAESGGIATFYRELLRQAEAEQRQIRLVTPGPETGVGTYGRYGLIYTIRSRPSPFSPGYRIISPG